MILSAAAAIWLSGGAMAQTYGFSTLQAGAMLNLQAQIMSKVVQTKEGMQMRVIPTAGTYESIVAVQAGDAEFSIADVNNVSDAIQAVDEYKGQPPLKDVRVAFKLSEFPISIMVRANGQITKIEHMKGKRFPHGWQAFPNGIPLSQAVLAAGGLSMADTVAVVTSGLIPAADDFKAGKTDGTLIALEAPKVREVDSSVDGGVRFLPMDNTPAALQRVQKVKPEYKIMKVDPGPRFAGVKEPLHVLRIDNLIITSAKVKDEAVEKFMKAIFDNKEELMKGHPSFVGFMPDKTASEQYSTVQYHPGAVKFLKARGLWSGK
jgi:TRAP transporter TAXI family solute receptor